ncbi:hypothetical protein GCK32_020448 [Trichostrongylus colubriformis]|uniref:Apple domain-containing protein n=1 Tax=Trichostrongylus colubriformis TaxID=6319 RepID=A0AAN8F6S6_TRICO
MSVIVIRVISLATLVHLSQITPALSCTFTERHYPRFTGFFDNSQYLNCYELQDCLRYCFENPLCNLLMHSEEFGQCNIYENAVITNGTNWGLAITTNGARFFVLDHNFSDTSCPTVEEWIKSDSTNH